MTRRRWHSNVITEDLGEAGTLTEGGEVRARDVVELTEEFYSACDAMRSEVGSAMVECMREALDDEKVVLETYPFTTDIAYKLKEFIEANPEKVRAAFAPVMDDLRKTLPAREKALQKRNRRY